MTRELFLQNKSFIESETESRITMSTRWHHGKEQEVLDFELDLPFSSSIRPCCALADLPDCIDEACEFISDALSRPVNFNENNLKECITNPEWLKEHIHTGLAPSTLIKEFDSQNLLFAPIIDTDLLVYFYVMISDEASVKVCHNWGLDWETAIIAADENDEKESIIEDIFDSLIGLGCDSSELTPKKNEDKLLLVLTNKRKQRGASLIMVPAIRKKLFELLGDDFRVIPSSIHEVLCFSKYSDENISDLTNMIIETNKHVVSERDFLSNKLYAVSEEKGIYALS